MDDTDKLERIPPLGKSVEEVERDTENRVNSATPREHIDSPEEDMPPAPFAGPTRAMSMRGTVTPLLGDERGADTHAPENGSAEEPTDNQA